VTSRQSVPTYTATGIKKDNEELAVREHFNGSAMIFCFRRMLSSFFFVCNEEPDRDSIVQGGRARF
jgi:hypothetical protein